MIMLTKDDVSRPASHTIYGVCMGTQATVLAKAAQLAQGPTIFVTLNDRTMEAHRQALQFIAPTLPVLPFPSWDCMPYDRISPNSSLVAQRLHTLSELLHWPANKPCVVLTTINAITQRLLPKHALKDAIFLVEKGKKLDQNTLLSYCAHLGFARVGKVMEPGEFSVRGSLVDVFAPGMSHACRIDWFGDVVESIRTFDPLTQRTDGHVDKITLRPASEVLMNQAAINQFRTQYRQQFGAIQKQDLLYESISEGRAYTGMEHWLPLFYAQMHSLLDYAPNAPVLLDIQVEQARKEREETIEDYYQARVHMVATKSRKSSTEEVAPYHPLKPAQLYIQNNEYMRLLETRAHLFLSAFSAPEDEVKGRLSLHSKLCRQFPLERKDGTLWQAFKQTVEEYAARKRFVMVACASAGAAERLKQLLLQHAIVADVIGEYKEIETLEHGVVGLANWPLERGFETLQGVVFSEQDILGERLSRTTKKRKATEYFMAEATSYAEGDLVVHREHGVGRFAGLVHVEAGGTQRDCLKLIYDGDDKLFIPVENIDVVSRYGSDEDDAVLDKLGGTAWQSRKARLKEKILLAAEELLKTAAARAIQQAAIYHPHPEFYSQFVRGFAYAETEDQERAIDDVLGDLTSGRPTDRLVCGDVGFGKTEVALRAAAAVACAENPAQVAVIAPTTLLARQHFANFKKRFEGLPVVVRQLSRFTTAKEMEDTHAGLKDGTVNIVVGTHALLSKQVEFKNLGLLIVDEEQHFGVAQKEKLKSLRANIHVLTLSATPIPRTLQMALTGVRDLSLITTPPVDRLAVRTFVMPYDALVIKEAIERERHRGGQVFYVTPRIQDLAELEFRIKELVPDAKLVVAHGQLPAAKLDQIMTDFDAGKYDILLSTSIVESGLDIPNANTLIVNRADRFGLSQLYQLRGRVGRGKTRAYAYFTLQHHKTLTANAMKRLEVMQTLDTLGAGFSVASHDMDIRGFGNLLGEEQSGHVREVGVELYQQMLEEAVEAARRGQKAEADFVTEDKWSPHINVGLSVLIPEDYVADLETRMGLYRRSAAMEHVEEIEDFAAELMDRFGPVPQEAQHFLWVLKVKGLCRQVQVEKLEAGPKGLTLTFRAGGTPLSPTAIMKFLASQGGKAKIRPDNKLVLMEEWKNDAHKMRGIEAFLQALGGLQAIAA